MKIAHVTIISVCAAVGFWWGFQRNQAAQRRVQLAALHQRDDELARLRREHDRLYALQPSDDDLARLRHASATREIVATTAAVALAAPKPSLQPGVWAAPAQWQNRGRATPEAALETMLWAAAGGDVAKLKATLEFDDASRAQAAALIAQMPEAVRTSPEDLLALMIAGNLPLESVQAVTQQQQSPDEVFEYVRIKDAKGQTRQIYLTLHRQADGWKLHVPASAVTEATRGI